MKKKFLLSTAVVLGLLLAAAPVQAVGVSAGASTWYAWWSYTPDPGGEFKPGLLYGPVLGVDFAKHWSVTGVFLTGSLEDPMYKYRRYDSDTVVNYSITRWLKIFGGLKYIRFDYNATGTQPSMFGSADSSYRSMGPGGGIGLMLPLSNSLFAIANISGLYCFAKFREPGARDDARDIGYNITAALAWHIATASTTLTLGGRYQYLDSQYDTVDYDSKTKFYGITFSAVYHFKTGSEE
jgi:hypothetical protein